MSTHSTTTYNAPVEETATTILEGAPTAGAQTRDMAAMEDSTTHVASASPDIRLAGVETEQQAIPKAREPRKKVPLTEQEIYLLADAIIANMKSLQTAIAALQEHVNSQLDDAEEKPLYQWDQYTGYSSLGLAISSLGLAVTDLEPCYLPEPQASSYRRRARGYSTAISKIAIFILSHMNKKCATCIEDLDASDLDAEGKQAALTYITSEVAKVLDYCSRATTRIWTAFDSLQAHLQPMPSREITGTVDATVRNTIASMIENYKQDSITENEHRKVPEPSANHCRIMTLFWFVVTVVCFYSTVQSLFPAASFAALQSTSRQSDSNSDIYRQTINLIERTNAVTNLTGEIYNIQLADLHRRYKALELTAEGTGLRLDNLMESLGPPNEQGNYYVSAQNADSEGVRQRVRKMQEDVEWRMQRLQKEMMQMRKNMHRIDIRLTKRLDKVGAGR